MDRRFTEEEVDMLDSVATEIEEIFYEMRKGDAQNKYVFNVPEGSTWIDPDNNFDLTPVPKEYIGYWMMSHARDLRYDKWSDCLKDENWVKVYQKEVISYEWVECE